MGDIKELGNSALRCLIENVRAASRSASDCSVEHFRGRLSTIENYMMPDSSLLSSAIYEIGALHADKHADETSAAGSDKL